MIEIPFPRDLWRTVSVQRFDIDVAAVGISSRFSPGRRVAPPVAELWSAEVTFDQMNDSDGRRLKAFLSRLRGSRNTVRLYDPSRRLPRGVAAGVNVETAAFRVEAPFGDATGFTDGTGWLDGATTCTVDEIAPAGASAVVLAGLVPSAPVALMAGDLIGIGGWLYEVALDIASDASGRARVPIAPGLRTGLLAGDLVDFDHPSTVFEVVGVPRVEVASGGPGGLWSGGLTLAEVPPR